MLNGQVMQDYKLINTLEEMSFEQNLDNKNPLHDSMNGSLLNGTAINGSGLNGTALNGSSYNFTRNLTNNSGIKSSE